MRTITELKGNLLFAKTESSARNKRDMSYKDIAPPPHGVDEQRLSSLVALLKDIIALALITEDDPVLQTQHHIRLVKTPIIKMKTTSLYAQNR
jgi:hypothetical protein